MKLCADLRVALWIIGMSSCMTLTYNIPEDDLVLTDNRIENLNADDTVGLARKRSFRTDYKSYSLDSPNFGNLGAITRPQIGRAGKLDERVLISDKRAYMHDPFTMMSEQLETVVDTLNNNNRDIQTMKSELAAKLNDLKAITKNQKSNTDTLDKLTGEVTKMKFEFMNMKSEFLTKLDELKTVGALLKLNSDTAGVQSTILDKLTNVNNQIQTISGTVNANSEKLDYLTNYVERRALYSSCRGYRDTGYTESGIYRINIPYTKVILTVHCDQETDGGGWLVFQRRQDGSIDFYRDWDDYKAGFGDVNGEFWLGNDHIHSLTRDQQELRVDLVDFDGNTAYAKYASFSVGSESDNYTLSVSGFSGTAGDSMASHNGLEFSTKDRDNDLSSGDSCAQDRKGGWWYWICAYANLNGLYHHSASHNATGIIWYLWKHEHVSLKKSEMKIRPKQ